MTKPNKTKKGVFLRLSKYVLAQWHLFIPALLFTLLANQLALMGPLFSGRAIDATVAENGVQFSAVWLNVSKMVFCYVISAILSYCLAVIMVHLSQRITRKMRSQLFNKLNTLPLGYFDTHKTGDIVSHLPTISTR